MHSASPFDRPSEFFVEVSTPKDPSESASTRERRAVTMGAADAPVDFLDEPTPQIDLRLLSRQLLWYVLVTVLCYGAFTIVFFIGIPMETVLEEIGTSKKAEEKVETYNTYSGFVMAMVEVFVAMHLDKFMPVFDVYVHNALYFMTKQSGSEGSPLKPKVSRGLHGLILYGFPVVLGLAMGNSLRGLQAAQSSAGFQRIMSVADLQKEQPALELIKATAASTATSATTALSTSPQATQTLETILLNAIREESIPFTFATDSPCGQTDTKTQDDESSAVASSSQTSRMVQLNVHDLDSTSAVYGFIAHEWNSEAVTTELTAKSTYTVTHAQVLAASAENGTKIAPPTDFSLAVAFEMLVQAKLVVERLQGDSTADTYDCSLSDGRYELDLKNGSSSSNGGSRSGSTGGEASVGDTAASGTATSRLRRLQQVSKRRRLEQQEYHNYDGEMVDDSQNQWTYNADGVRQCQGAVTSLFNMYDFYIESQHTPEYLLLNAAAMMGKTLKNLSNSEAAVTLEKYELTPQIQVEAMRIDILIDSAVSYGLNTGCTTDTPGFTTGDVCNSTYYYTSLGESFCGSDGCAFLDMSSTFTMQREIGVMPYVVNCTLDVKHVHYSADFRGFYPSDCTKVANTAFLYGIGSYVTGDEYGSNDTETGTNEPYITNPRRHLRLTFAKVTWKTEKLDEAFNATCGAEDADCIGLWYKLESSGRYIFAGDVALPGDELLATDFRSPIPLVQLNSPRLYVEKLGAQVTLESLKFENFKKVAWDGQAKYNGSALGGDTCSMLMDSYLQQVDNNNYKLEKPLQAMYTAFFYYLMQNAAVTQLNDTAAALNASNQTAATALSSDRLGNARLQGDKQLRSIKVSIPSSSFYTTLAGCAIVLVLMVAVLVVPARRVEAFEEGTSKAQEFMVMRSDEEYPPSVHDKTLLHPESGEAVPFDQLEIERMALVHETDRGRLVYL